MDDCKPCPAGYACLTAGLSHYNDQVGASTCPAGSYCLSGTNTDTAAQQQDDAPIECPAGYQCPAGTAVRQVCLEGTY